VKHSSKLILCLLLLVVPMLGCGKDIAYLKNVPAKYIAETPASKPGRGERIYVANATDDREEAEDIYGQAIAVPEKGTALTTAVTDSIKDCLITYGYVVVEVKDAAAAQPEPGRPARILYTSIESLYCRRELGYVVSDIGISKLSFDLKERGGTKPIWSDRVDKKAEVVSAVMASIVDAENAVNKAFAESMKAFESDISSPDFRNALTASPGVSAEPAGASH
jgi:hypothetical protein